MKRFQSLLCASLLTLSIASAAFAGDISGRSASIAKGGDISGKSNITKPGDISGLTIMDAVAGIILYLL